MSSEYFSLDQEVYKLCEYLTWHFSEGGGGQLCCATINWMILYLFFLASIQTKNVIQISL